MQKNGNGSSDSGTSNTATIVSALFCALDSDVTLRSANGVDFHLHRKNLEVNTGAFPPAEIETRGEIVQLSEDSPVLELLFQFIYRMQHPNLAATPFETIQLLAEAAEKYEVYSAMNVCNIRMRLALAEHTEVVIAYAVRHGYHDILKECAPLLLNKPLSEIVDKTPLKFIIPWVRYYDEWNRVLEQAKSYPSRWNYLGRSARCKHMRICCCIVMVLHRMTSVRSLQNLDQVFANTSPEWCKSVRSNMKIWRESVEASILGIPPFSTFCRASEAVS